MDDAQGVITAVVTTSGAVPENQKLMELINQHEQNAGQPVQTAVGDHKYGTADNFVACHEQGIVTHLGDAKAKQATASAGLLTEKDFACDAASDTYTCPTGQELKRRRYVKKQRAWEYGTARGVCGGCPLRTRCTHSTAGRVVRRHERHELLEECRRAAPSAAARADRRRRQYLLAGSFADAANNHGFKRARWRRLWRQQIQDHLIATIQNVRLLLARTVRRPAMSAVLALVKAFGTLVYSLGSFWPRVEGDA